MENKIHYRPAPLCLAFAATLIIAFAACTKTQPSPPTTCAEFGAPPMQTVAPVTRKPFHEDGQLLEWKQDTVTRYASLNYPAQAEGTAKELETKEAAASTPHADRRFASGMHWPLVIYLHGSLTTPSSLYEEGRQFFQLRDTFQLSTHDSVQGFIILSPEGRHATPWADNGIHTGTGFHWDEWYRNPDKNLDVLAIDHFLDEVLATGMVDSNQIYMLGWSNGAFMTVLYSSWRSDRIAAMAQYAGGNPWARTPCPVPMQYTRQVPLVLLRNLCDALVPCDTTNKWIDTLKARHWPFEHYSLDSLGTLASNDSPCQADCPKLKGKVDHIHWPKRPALLKMLEFFKAHPME